ncbi:UNVERIFIED_CONTAM: hypothetical protein ABIC26_002674 [Paenibacillus sp. PvR008]
MNKEDFEIWCINEGKRYGFTQVKNKELVFVDSSRKREIEFFKENQNNQDAYDLQITDLTNGFVLGLPYQLNYFQKCEQMLWRNSLRNFSSDIAIILKAMDNAREGYLRMKILKWNKVRGFGFATCAYCPKVYIHARQFPKEIRQNLDQGVKSIGYFYIQLENDYRTPVAKHLKIDL